MDVVCRIGANTLIVNILNMKRNWNRAHIVEQKRLKKRVDVQSKSNHQKRQHIFLKHTGMGPIPHLSHNHHALNMNISQTHMSPSVNELDMSNSTSGKVSTKLMLYKKVRFQI